MRAYIDPFFGHMLVERVTREDVRSFRLWLESRTTLSVGSVLHVLSDGAMPAQLVRGRGAD